MNTQIDRSTDRVMIGAKSHVKPRDYHSAHSDNTDNAENTGNSFL